MKTTLGLILSLFLIQSTSAQVNNYSIDFDGVDDYISIPTASAYDAINSELTVTAWIKADSTSSGASPRIVDRSEGNGGGVDRWLLSWTSTNDNLVMSFAVGSANTETVFGTTPINLNEWTHVAATFNNGFVQVFINGILDGSSTIAFTDLLHVQGVDINIGAVNGNNSFFPGKIDEVSIWDAELDSLTIKDYMNCPPMGNEANLVGYWRFEEGSGTITNDATSNMNDGTLNNGPIWDGDAPFMGCDLGISEIKSIEKELIKIVDLMGRETELKSNTILINVYSDGTTEKVYRVE